MTLPVFLLITTNVYFFLGLAFYVQSRSGVFFALSSVGAMLVLLGVGWSQNHADPMVAAFFPGLVAFAYLIGALICFKRSGLRPDFFGKAITLSLISTTGFAATACVVLLEWPLR